MNIGELNKSNNQLSSDSVRAQLTNLKVDCNLIKGQHVVEPIVW
jgi:hypothetical protein